MFISNGSVPAARGLSGRGVGKYETVWIVKLISFGLGWV